MMMVSIMMTITVLLPQSAEADGKRVAFVVGVARYDNLPIDKQLKSAVHDADGVSAMLTQIGFEVMEQTNLTRRDFSDKWQNVLDTFTKDDTFVLYFSGHGVQIDGQNYLLPRDIPFVQFGRQAQLQREAISLNELLNDLSSGNRAHPKQSVVILDACRDNPFIPPGYKGTVARGGLAKLPEPEGVFVIYSAASNSTALERLSSNDQAKYSVFTRALLPLMKQTDLTIQQLSSRLRNEVHELAQTAGYEQTPTYYDGILGTFCLPGCDAKAGQEPDRVAKLEADLRALQDRQADRRLTVSQRNSLAVELSKGEKGEIQINFVSGNSEAARYATDIGLALQDAGWTITRMNSAMFIGDPPVGVYIASKDQQMPRVSALFSALQHIGLRVELKIKPKADPPVQLIVGNKP
jgi:hypothetical protein